MCQSSGSKIRFSFGHVFYHVLVLINSHVGGLRALQWCQGFSNCCRPSSSEHAFSRVAEIPKPLPLESYLWTGRNGPLLLDPMKFSAGIHPLGEIEKMDQDGTKWRCHLSSLVILQTKQDCWLDMFLRVQGNLLRNRFHAIFTLSPYLPHESIPNVHRLGALYVSWEHLSDTNGPPRTCIDTFVQGTQKACQSN